MKKISVKLRKLAVEVLSSPKEKLYVEGDECITSGENYNCHYHFRYHYH